MTASLNLYGEFAITLDTLSIEQIFEFVRQLIFYLKVSDVYVCISPEDEYNVADFANKFFPQCKLLAEPIQNYDYQLRDVQMVRFSPALFDVKLIRVMPDRSLFFATELAFETETATLADLLERQKATMSPYQPTSCYNYDELAIEQFPLPLITRTYEIPLRHMVLLSSKDTHLITFSRAAEMYYITPKETALCFLGKLQRTFGNLLNMEKVYTEKERALLKDFEKTSEQSVKYSRAYLFTKRKEARHFIIARLRNVAEQIRRKQEQIDDNNAIFKELSSVHSLTPIWSSVEVLLNAAHIKALTPFHAGLLRGYSNIAVAACNCGYFIAPVFTSKLFNFEGRFYRDAIISGADRNIYQAIAAEGKQIVKSRNQEVTLAFKLTKREALDRDVFFQYQKRSRDDFIRNEATSTKRNLFSGLRTDMQGFEDFNFEYAEKYIPTELEELCCTIDGSTSFAANQIITEMRNWHLNGNKVTDKVQEIANNISVFELLAATGWGMDSNETSIVRICVSAHRDGSVDKGIIADGRFSPE